MGRSIVMTDFVDIKGFEGIYEINKQGVIRSRYYKNKTLKYIVSTPGYYFVNLWKDKQHKGYFIHRLLAEAFIPNPENKAYVNHKDGNKMNNDLSNLEWSTPSENMQHAYDTGLNKGPRGEFSGHHKLTTEQVIFIKSNKGKYPGVELAKKFGVLPKQIYAIQGGKRWAHVEIN